MTVKENIKDIYGLSPMQKGMLLNHALDPASSAYVEQFDFRISGDVEAERMEWALNRLVERYDILRTVFSYRKTDEPRQVVLKSRAPEFTLWDLREEAVPEEALEAFKEEQKQKGFNLSGDVLVRGALLQLEDKKWSFVFTFHHILLDGWSVAPLFKELFGLYEISANPQSYQAVGEAHPYSEYIRWLQKQDEATAVAYWKNYLEGYEKPAALPSYGNAGAYKHATQTFRVPKALSAELNALAQARNLTVNAIFQTAWGLVLQTYNHTRDVVFGNVVSGRTTALPGIESMVGLFINTQPLRIQTEESDSFASLCAKVHKAVFQSLSFEYFPLYEIQSRTQLKNNLLDHVVAFENYPLAEQLRQVGSKGEGALHIEDVHVFERTNYDFGVVINPGEEFVVTFTYNESRYAKDTMESLERSLTTLLESAVSNPDLPVDRLSVCSAHDKLLVLERFNGSRQEYPRDQTVDRMFRETVAKFPQKTALEWKDRTYTYEELDVWSDRLAHLLRAKGLGPHSAVGLFVPRCPEMVAGMLGILKTGASFVPLDLANSAERLQYMIEDADLKVICTRSDVCARLPQDLDFILMDESMDSVQAEQEESNHEAESQAYLMYTSGSSGQPKGCKITHRNILRLVFGPDFIEFGPHQVILQTGSPAFDASTFEVWGALLHGGTLVLASEEELLDAEKLKEVVVRHRVRNMWLTSPLFNRLCEEDAAMFASLESLIVGGDALSVRHIRKVKESAPHLRVVNGYGPTENTTFSTTHLITESDLASERIPIGRPLAHSTVYIVDQALRPVPVGAIGEICVGGDGVGLGYQKKPEQTSRYFLDDPFFPGGRMYRTGDLGRWLPDGTVDYLGRTDFQVKIRGYRVEPGEIERAMEKLPNIKEVTVQVKEVGQDKHLCAYYTAEQVIDLAEWRKILSAKLPQYMIPSFFVLMETMPLTLNGKIDHRSLPDPMLSRQETRVPSRALTDTEKVIARICAAVLGVSSEDINVDDNFFEIGINSLNMISINNKLKDEFKRSIPLTVLFEHTSVARLADYLQSNREEDDRQAMVARNQEITTQRGVLQKTSSLIRRMGERS